MLSFDLPSLGRKAMVMHDVRLSADGKDIEYRIDRSTPVKGQVRGSEFVSESLHAFIALTDEESDAFITFAKQFGVLALSRVKAVDATDDGIILDGARWSPCEWPEQPSPNAALIPRGSQLWRSEPLAGWRAYATEARSILDAALNLQRGELINNVTLRAWNTLPGLEGFHIAAYATDAQPWEPSNDERESLLQSDRQELRDLLKPARQLSLEERLREQRGILAVIVTRRWLDSASLRPALHWYVNDKPRFSLASRGKYHDQVFSALSFQLVTEICAAERLIVCDECGTPFAYEKERKPRSDRPHFCAVCKGKHQRARQRRYREKQAGSAG